MAGEYFHEIFPNLRGTNLGVLNLVLQHALLLLQQLKQVNNHVMIIKVIVDFVVQPAINRFGLIWKLI